MTMLLNFPTLMPWVKWNMIRSSASSCEHLSKGSASALDACMHDVSSPLCEPPRYMILSPLYLLMTHWIKKLLE